MGFLSPADFGTFDLFTRLPICLIGIGFSVLLVVFFRPQAVRQHISRAAWSMLVIAFLVTYAIVVALGPSGSFLGMSFNVASRRIFILFDYIFFSELIYELTLPAFGIFSLANALFLAAPYTLRTIISASIGQGVISMDVEMVALFMMLIIACSFVLLFNGIQGFAEEGASEPRQVPPYSEATLTAFASDIGLSAREREVLALLALNKSLQCIADTLGISINTLRSHTRSIYRKANVHSRQELLEKMGHEGIPREAV